MKIGVPKETRSGETRVAMVPSALAPLLREKHEFLVQSGAGIHSGWTDEDYTKAGARVVPDAVDLFREADVILKVSPPSATGPDEAGMIRKNSVYVGYLAPLNNRDVLKTFQENNVTAFAMEYVPRITRAQSMDALSSMATVAGYKAVLLATEKLGKMFPLLMTAAGTVPAATVLILGAGVAGLQAIATAKRLGARVEAFDPRPAVKEQVKSLGATFIEMEAVENAETSGGYAREMSAEFLKKEQEAIAARLPKVDVVISTAQVFGKRAPILITADMVKLMRRGTVIVDLAAEQGGNCELTRPSTTIEHAGVTIIGATNLPASIPVDASLMYSKNLVNLLQTIYPKGVAEPNFEDEVVRGACIVRSGEIVNASVQEGLKA